MVLAMMIKTTHYKTVTTACARRVVIRSPRIPKWTSISGFWMPGEKRRQYFEKVIHRSIEINKPGQMTATIRSKRTGRNGVDELDKANAYWIPSIPNFADIDAAIVVGSTLHAIKDTIETTHTFDTQRFWDSFASVVLAKVVFKAIKIHFLCPPESFLRRLFRVLTHIVQIN
jgi:hypothetical protein